MHKPNHIIKVQAKAKTTLKRIAANKKFQFFVTEVLEDSAVSFSLRGNALEGFEFEIPEVRVDLTDLIAELTEQASKLKG